MNMMTPQEEFEEQAVPFSRADLPSDFDFPSESEGETARPGSLFERFGWFRNLSISGKVQAIFGTFFAVSFAMALVLGLGLGEGWARLKAAIEASDAMHEALELRTVAGDMRYNSARYLFAGEEVILERQRDAYRAAEGRIVVIEGLSRINMAEFLPAIGQIRKDLTEYNRAYQTVVAAQERGESPQQLDVLAQDLAGKGQAFLDDTRELADGFARLRTENRQTGLTYLSFMLPIVLALGAMAIAVLISGLRYLSRDFTHKIVEVANGMAQLARGNRNFEIEGHERKDEIGQMLRALTMFKRANQQLEIWAHERTERAEEEMRLQQERENERAEAEQHKAALLDDVARQFERTVGDVVASVATASSELGATAKRMASTAEETSERADGLSKHMNEANSGATAAASASDEFAVSIAEISRQASSSSQLARLASDATEEADTTISELADTAEQVGNIVELISTIAKRTNLLALNASIEAARGGGAGRGFAVVASEVKELAMQTSRATDEIAEQIRKMQSSTGDTVMVLRAIAGQVKEMESTAVSIASAVDQQSVAGQDLARSIDRAAQGTGKVTEHIEDVRQMSLSTGAAANQVLESAGGLERQAATLKAQVRTFLLRVREG